MRTTPTFGSLLESFFTDRLMRQRQASPHTIASYRDTFRLLLHYAQQHLRKPPSTLTLRDLNTSLLGAFLDYLEKTRRNSARSRNVRLAAIHSFFRYVALHAPEYSGQAQQVLAIPSKRFVRRPIAFLTAIEVNALLDAPDLNTWSGRRDRAVLMLTLQTGLRAAELLGLRCDDIVLGAGAHVKCLGKGRKHRCTPLRKDTVAVLRSWLQERRGQPADPAFPTRQGTPLGHDGLEYLLNKHLAVARNQCPSLKEKRITPHSLRHSLAMSLLGHGVDSSTIALWLGHEQVATTSIYLQSDMQLKQKALSKTHARGVRTRCFKTTDRVLSFLKSL